MSTEDHALGTQKMLHHIAVRLVAIAVPGWTNRGVRTQIKQCGCTQNVYAHELVGAIGRLDFRNCGCVPSTTCVQACDEKNGVCG